MPIDPSIPASAFSNRPLAGLGDVYEQQRTRAQTDEIQARTRILTQSEEQKRLEAEDAKIRNAKLQAIWEQWGAKDVKRAVALTYTVDPDSAAKIDEQIAKSANQWAQEAAHHDKTEGERLGRYVSMFQGATTPALLAAVKQRYAQEDPENAAVFDSITDPADPALPALIEMGMKAKEIHEARAKHLEFIQKGQGEGTFAKGIAGVLAVTPQDHWDEVLQGAGPLLGEAQTQALASMTPQQLQSLAMGQEATVRTGETQRSNLAREAETVRENNMQNAAVLRGQNLDATIAREKMKAGAADNGGELTPNDLAMIDGLMTHPEMYNDLTPTVKSRLAVGLMARGFDTKKATTMTPSMQAGINRLQATVQQLEQMDAHLTQSTGVMGKVAGHWQAGRAAAGMDEVASAYDGLSDTLLPALARASGEVGNLAQEEQTRYAKLAPKLTDPINVRKLKLTAIKNLIAAATKGASAADMVPLLDYNAASAETATSTNPFRKPK